MVADLEMDGRQKEALVSFLRRLLAGLEAGRTVRVALDLKAVIDELEGSKGKPGHIRVAEPGDASVEKPPGRAADFGSGMVADSIWA